MSEIEQGNETPRPMPRRLRYSPRAFLRRGAFAAAVRFSGLFCVFLLQILLARLIGDTAEYGKYAWGQSLLFAVGILAGMALPVVTSRFIASLDAQHNTLGAREVTRAALRLLRRSTALPPILAVLLWVTWSDAGASRYGYVAMLALLFAPALTFATFFRDAARARQWLGLSMVPLQIARPLLTAVFALIIARVLGVQLDGLATLCLSGASIVCVLAAQSAIYHVRQRSLPEGSPANPHPDEFRPGRLMSTARPLFITRCAELVSTYSNVLLVGYLAGPAAAGAYFAAERLAQLVVIPKAVVSIINQQSMAAAHATGRQGELQLLATQSAHGAFWPTLVIGGLLAVFATPLLGLFGRDFTAAAPILMVLIASGFVHVFAGPAQDILIMTGRQRRIPAVIITAAIGHILALLLLVPVHGAVGAAMASVVSTCIAQFWLLRLARREAGIKPTVLSSFAAARQ